MIDLSLQTIFVKSNLYPKLIKNNITNVKELILKKPKKYENFFLYNLNKISNKKKVNVFGIINKEPVIDKNLFTTPVKIFQILIKDNINVKIILFNIFYSNLLKINQKIFIQGIYYTRYNSIIASFISSKININENIQPIYKLKNISDIEIQKLIKNFFQHPQFKIKENLNENFVKKYNLINRQEALKNLHLPKNQTVLNQTIKRFKYEEAFFITKKILQKEKLSLKTPLKCNIHYVKEMIKKIPFKLTPNQKKIVNEIYSDFLKNYQTKRLIQGDVGSGKTIIVFIAALGIINLNKQVLIMAPTEILAQQHYFNFKKIFPQIKSIFITSKSKKKKILQKLIKDNYYKIIFGTHLLANIEFNQLGLIVIDESHKFGEDIKNKTISQNINSDIIYLTATPIPKTLTTIYFGLLKISLLKKEHYNDQNIITKKCSFKEMFSLLQQNQNRNEQTYIVVPAIKDNKKAFNIENINIFLKKKNINNIYILHSEQKSEKQEQTMHNFINDTKGILLATSIIEVGIDISNATTIIILGAEYFGLSQLHQLRGRVGRNNKKNYCFLIYSKDNERLDALKKENNGFNLSKIDLKKRGPGDFLGKKQSGFFKYNFLNIFEDFQIINQVQKDFKNFIN